MTLSQWLYLVDVLDNIDTLIGLSVFSFLAFLVIFGVVSSVWHDDDDGFPEWVRKAWSSIYRKMWVFFVALSVSLLIPSQKTMYLMLGSSYLSTTGIPTKVQQALELKLDDVINELKHPRTGSRSHGE